MVLKCPQSCNLQPRVLGAERDSKIWDKGHFSWEKALTGFLWVISTASSNTIPSSGARTPREGNIPCTTRGFHFSFGDGLPCALPSWAATFLACPTATPCQGRTADGMHSFEHSLNPGWAGLQRGLDLDKGDPATCWVDKCRWDHADL